MIRQWISLVENIDRLPARFWINGDGTIIRVEDHTQGVLDNFIRMGLPADEGREWLDHLAQWEDDVKEYMDAIAQNSGDILEFAMNNGWVRGGTEHDNTGTLYLHGRDMKALRGAAKHLYDRGAQQITIDAPQSSDTLDPTEFKTFVKTGRLP